jgi:hypothetical protein
MSNKKPSLLQRLFGGIQPAQPETPENDAFSVVSGKRVTTQGNVVAFSAIVPTVFHGHVNSGSTDPLDAFFDGAENSNGVAREETLMFAEELAQEQFPRSSWMDEDAVEIRSVTEQEQAWALANGVNKRFGA